MNDGTAAQRLPRRGNVQTLTGAGLQSIGDGIQLPLGVERQVGALRQVPVQQPVGILFGPALPGTMRIGKEDPELREAGPAVQGWPSLCPGHRSG